MMNLFRRFLFYVLNTPDSRRILNRWKSEDRIRGGWTRFRFSEITPAKLRTKRAGSSVTGVLN
jgi:hypothetical protein